MTQEYAVVIFRAKILYPLKQLYFAGVHRKCGSGLARECGVSGNTSGTDTPLSRASPLPQFSSAFQVRRCRAAPGAGSCLPASSATSPATRCAWAPCSR
ncbi:hypothetical protein FJD34_06330 [Pseudomonas brenneri]|uniref:Uncharacterized protein n=1 Tax=Pseudomonas brenneri TaxID=129817 RepID=A0A5B2UWE0_9PSED|nr:hypothetical protein [Pseudomonas brenneri]KAA2230235.1 hypothetical protein F1720_13355 [Pseudomonas brenneri]TWR81472.1 hypothetical protein FJD34_06330 [Pseudomonas brenneri]